MLRHARSPRAYLRFRTLALIPIVLFIPTLVSFVTSPGAKWAQYTGILVHISILFLVSRMDTPSWARSAGFLWLGIDVLASVMVINNVPDSINWPTRLGGHVMAGIWILMSSVYARSRAVQFIGAITGIWLAGYSFVGDVLPRTVLYPASLMIVVWFIVLAVVYSPEAERVSPQPTGSRDLASTGRAVTPTG